ncbi:MAG: DUF3841 domain-containing protein [Firmicutes bacterium]|nr:DUF3841 domain-containing protein [Mogibacterium sp.]MBR3183353.1 DUF3841 domain-containing protein [Bacillota bacterium]
MDTERNTVTLFSPQAEAVWDALMRDGVAYSRREYITKKYEESAGIFLAAYDVYINEACRIVPRPDDRAYPYWAFASKEQLDLSGGGRVMTLEVPVNEAVFFDQYDWYKVLRLSYIGESEEDEAAFARKLAMRGIRDSSEAVLKPFYPDIRREITGSWKRLFRHDGAIKKGDASSVRAVQAGLWCIKKEWLI